MPLRNQPPENAQPLQRRVATSQADTSLLPRRVAVAVNCTAPVAESEGKAILENNCGRCHSLGASGEAPSAASTAFAGRFTSNTHIFDQLEEGFAEGMGSRHRDMPQIQFSPDQVAAILNYLGTVTGIDPATRARAVIPGETPP